MKLIDVTNSHRNLVSQQLQNTDTNFIRVFSLGPTTVILSEAKTHRDVVLKNPKRNIKKTEINYALQKILKVSPKKVDIIFAPNIAEISMKVENPTQKSS
ncbi:DUF1827 family protein [Pisciglobus halotolerans]|uniref:DUF1827 family protein n=1 Tax=Pisciglobus halotolerans TaxID=745365 RepID=A0A1I3BXK3_9LACT|nr:DUF1827 family protein [Pisciglobus halotolerans]SFH66943.1 protein of unknown function [Pisciglobus halotolerans]